MSTVRVTGSPPEQDGALADGALEGDRLVGDREPLGVGDGAVGPGAAHLLDERDEPRDGVEDGAGAVGVAGIAGGDAEREGRDLQESVNFR